jgi:hypothetical protein
MGYSEIRTEGENGMSTRASESTRKDARDKERGGKVASNVFAEGTAALAAGSGKGPVADVVWDVKFGKLRLVYGSAR